MPVHRPPPVRVSLAQVYAIDFGRRTEDLALWAALRARAPEGPTIEVGVGDGRASGLLPGERYGIDLDLDFVYRARAVGIQAIQGDAAEARDWNALPRDAGLVFCAFSTLFLIPHDRQASVIRNMLAHLAPGGILAVETFQPTLAPGMGQRLEIPVRNPNGVGPDWTRCALYVARADNRIVPEPPLPPGCGVTNIVRRYGPERDEWRMELHETVYWRTPDAMLDLFREAGACGGQSLGREVPSGSVLTHYTRALAPSEAP